MNEDVVKELREGLGAIHEALQQMLGVLFNIENHLEEIVKTLPVAGTEVE